MTPSTPVVSKLKSPMRVVPDRAVDVVGSTAPVIEMNGRHALVAVIAPIERAGGTLKILSPLIKSSVRHSTLIQCVTRTTTVCR